MASVKVEIFSDLVCPWCFIGKRRFERAVESLRADGLAHDLEVVVDRIVVREGIDPVIIDVRFFTYVKSDSPSCRVVVKEVVEEVVRSEIKEIVCA